MKSTIPHFIFVFFFFKQKTAYEIYQCDWSSDVCSSDLQSDPISFDEDDDLPDFHDDLPDFHDDNDAPF